MRTLPNYGVFISKFESFFTFYDYKTVQNQIARRLFSPQIFGAFSLFLTTRLHYGDHPDDGRFFLGRTPILFNITILHLLHCCIHCDLEHSCSILHESLDGTVHFFGYQTVRGHVTKLHDGFEFGGFCPFFYYQTARWQPL